MVTNDFRIQADLHQPIKNGYRLKVNVYALGMYINGWQMYRSSRHKSGWQSKAPYYSKNGKIYRPLEFDKKEQLWKDIEQACLDAVWEEEKLHGTDNNPFKKVKATEI